MRSIANGISINFDMAGQGPPVVLIHGLAMDLSLWDSQMPALQPHFKTIRYDVRGHGRSESAAPPYSLELLADDLHYLLRSVGVEAAHLVGLSMGGMIAQTFALTYPAEVLGLALCCTTSEYPQENRQTFHQRAQLALEQGMQSLVEGTLARWFTPSYRERNPPAVQNLREVYVQVEPSCYAAAARAVSEIDLTDRLHEIPAPTLIVAGEQDPGTPVAWAQRMQEKIAGSRLEMIPEASHCCNVEQPERFNQALIGFLTSLDAAVPEGN